MKPTRHKFISLQQIMQHVPAHIINNLSEKHKINKQSRTFTPWSHIVSLVYAQLSHALSLNDVCDSLRNHCQSYHGVRGAIPPSRNGLSHANRNRTAKMAEDVFWQTLTQLQAIHPAFGFKRRYKGIPHRFKKAINIIDSTTISLVANCMDWAKHRRRKAAVKCHMRLNLRTFLPNYVLVKSADSHDSTEAWELCSDIKSGEIVVFDKAYIDFKHLLHLTNKQIFWVSRVKDNMAYNIVGQQESKNKKILLNAEIELKLKSTKAHYPNRLRLIKALVEIDGKEVEMEFMSNNLNWSPSSICDLYKARWSIEVFFKQLKQTLQLSGFLGHNENAIKWQIWTALLTYVLLRFIAYEYSWKGSFARLFTILRSILWNYFDIKSVLYNCSGTAKGPPSMLVNIEQLYMPGFKP